MTISEKYRDDQMYYWRKTAENYKSATNKSKSHNVESRTPRHGWESNS